jgi:hypothetical protein
MKVEASTTIRVNNDPALRKTVEDKETLTAALGAVVADAQRLVGVGDPIMAMAQGAVG